MPGPRLVLTRHAQDMIEEREIDLSWDEQTISAPAYKEQDPARPEVIRAFRRIAERDGRMLRVVYAADNDTIRVLTVFFDRKRR